jgi:hypothetical protein
MRDVLADHATAPDVAAGQYEDLMTRYLSLGEKRLPRVSETPLPPPPPSMATAAPDDAQIKQTLASVPGKYKPKAKLLIAKLKQHPDLVTWDQRGRLTVKGQPVADSNLTDLVNDALRTRKGFEPAGWRTFASVLKEIDTPRDFIGNTKRWTWMQQQQRHETSATKDKTKKKKGGRKRWESL